MNGLELRPITRNDLEFARQIRNANRQSFVDNREISPEQQLEWFESLANRACVDFRIVWFDGVRVGTMSVTIHPDGSREIGNGTLLTEYRGRGIGTAAEAYFVDPTVRCWGTYLEDNLIAATVMLRAGFIPIPIRREMIRDHQLGHSPTH